MEDSFISWHGKDLPNTTQVPGIFNLNKKKKKNFQVAKIPKANLKDKQYIGKNFLCNLYHRQKANPLVCKEVWEIKTKNNPMLKWARKDKDR